jgi:hypothetical protein
MSRGPFPEQLGTYAKAVEANYHRLAEIFLSSASESRKVERLMEIQFTPVPTIKGGYIVWWEGILAEGFACFPTTAFPRLLEAVRTAGTDEDLSLIFKALTMWGDGFAEALSPWLESEDVQLRRRALHGLTGYAKLLNTFCDPSHEPTLKQQLQRENYPELVRSMRAEDISASPTSVLSGSPRLKRLKQLSERLDRASEESEQIDHLRCLWQLWSARQDENMDGFSSAVEKTVAIATNAVSRKLEREALIALCHLEREGASEYVREHWLNDTQRRSMAAEMLGLIRTETAFEMLRELVTDTHPETRRKAISSIESFESVEALDLLNSLREREKKAHRQLLRSRSQLKRRIQRRGKPPVRRWEDTVYFISPLALLSRIPTKPLFSEQELNAALEKGIIADISASRRYAVELGLLERHGDIYRLSGIGTVVHWVETVLQEGLGRFGEAA